MDAQSSSSASGVVASLARWSLSVTSRHAQCALTPLASRMAPARTRTLARISADDRYVCTSMETHAVADTSDVLTCMCVFAPSLNTDHVSRAVNSKTMLFCLQYAQNIPKPKPGRSHDFGNYQTFKGTVEKYNRADLTTIHILQLAYFMFTLCFNVHVCEIIVFSPLRKKMLKYMPLIFSPHRAHVSARTWRR